MSYNSVIKTLTFNEREYSLSHANVRMWQWVLYSSYPKKVVSHFDGIVVDKEHLTPYK